MKSFINMIFPKHGLFMTTALTAAAMAGLCLEATGAWATDPILIEPSLSGPEAILVKSLQEIAESRMDSALSGIEQLLKTNPNFRLAHLIKGDLLLARARPISEIGGTVEIPQQNITDLREEAQARMQRHQETIPLDMMPKYLLQMPPEQKYAVIANTRKSRLYIYKNLGGKPHYFAD